MEEIKKTPEGKGGGEPYGSAEFLQNPELIKVRVALAIIEKEGKFLIGKRPSHKPYGGKWEFPGGKIEEEKGETPEGCVARELGEELGIHTSWIQPYLEYDYRFPDGNFFHIVAFRCEIDADPELRAHEELRWVFAGELEDYDFIAGDSVLVNSIKRAKNKT